MTVAFTFLGFPEKEPPSIKKNAKKNLKKKESMHVYGLELQLNKQEKM